ncbi:MAG: hypothetical protein NTY15_08575 [Planctomycetota bacterium]|jgi:hypothetical protein|nr:hypothetical protein [Planctomycetota bacterium]
MNRCRFSFLSLNALAFGIAISLAALLGNANSAFAQTKRTVLDATRALDAPLDKDLEWVTAFLESSIAKNETDAMANCVLSIIQFRKQEFENALKSIERSNSGEKAKITRATTGRIQLLCAINLDDGPTATKLFQDLLNACQRETATIALRKTFCEWMGEIIGSLDSVEAKSPIDIELLAKAKKSLLGIAETKLSQAFESQYTRSHSRADEIRKMLERYGELGDAGMQELDTSMSAEIEKLEEILAASVKESREISSENQALAKSLRLEMGNLREQIRRIEVERVSNGPGMPAPMFPPQGPPVPPNRNAIYVDPYYIQTVTEYVNNQPVTQQIQTRRDSRDIESERNSIYQTQLSFYQTQLNTYNQMMSLYSQYQKNLAEWKKSEEQRRNKLADQRRELESQIGQVKTKLDEIEDIKKGNAGGNADLRKSIAPIKSELELVRLVLNAGKAGKPYIALRPRTLDPWLITEEKNRLLKLFADAN